MSNYVLITGATGGIGGELAKIFASKGHNLILVGREANRGTELKSKFESEYQVKVESITADLSQPDGAQKVFDETRARGLEVEVLVNDAGFGEYGKFEEIPLEKQVAMSEVNSLSLMKLTHLFLPQMLARKNGKILNVASTAAFQPGPFMNVYYATKAYVIFFSEALAAELEGRGVTVTCLCPGPTRTRFFDHLDEMKKTNLLRLGNKMDPVKVAEVGYKALMKGKRVVVPGFWNKVGAVMPHFVPRGVALYLSKWTLK